MTETAPPGDAAVAAAPALRDYALANNLGATTGAVFLTGTQALVRLLRHAQRGRSRRELEREAVARGASREEAAEVIDDLLAQGLLVAD